MGKPTAGSGEYVLSTLRMGMECLGHRMIDAMVYAPLNKQAMKMAGMKAEDELHYFAGILGHTGTISEINVCGELWTSRVTSHVPLRFVADLITGERIEAVARLLHRAIAAAGTEQPRIAVAGVNPHAGEGGHLGTEEIDLIAPSVERLRADGMQVTGPLPADTLFIAARRGDFDGVVTMYHDQGQIALKLMGFERGVTVAGGLPVVIATPAHGTAFDIAGKGIADPGAMKSAFLLACRMAES
jgi:4-hydroxythreonine-4-phosphate dehydrogenase